MYVDVYLEKRYRLVDEKQTLPFSIYHCEEYIHTDTTDKDIAESQLLKEKILKRLQARMAGTAFYEALVSPEWMEKDIALFSFEVFSFVQLEPNELQGVLEMDSTKKRLQYFFSLLN